MDVREMPRAVHWPQAAPAAKTDIDCTRFSFSEHGYLTLTLEEQTRIPRVTGTKKTGIPETATQQ